MNQTEQIIFNALRTYSNVHRGSGYNSMVTTENYEQAKLKVLGYLGLNKKSHRVVFCSPRQAQIITSGMKTGSYQVLSGSDAGLAIGLRAIAAKRKALSTVPKITGGGTTRLISGDWIVWAKPPDRHEAGTPSVINAIAFSSALEMKKKTNAGELIQIKPENTEPALNHLVENEVNDLKGEELLAYLRDSVVGKDVTVEASGENVTYLNLDHGASTRTFWLVWEAYRHALNAGPARRSEITGNTRRIIARFLGAPMEQYDILFTSNTTEALNLAAESLSMEAGGEAEPVVINTLLEHNSNELPWRFAKGVHHERLGVDKQGFIDLNELETRLTEYNVQGRYGKRRVAIVAVSGASNVLGTCNDLAAIGRITHKHGARLLIDAAQLVAHRPVVMAGTGIDYLAFSGHKIYAPFGSGALVVRKGFLKFSDQELSQIQDSGEENLAGIAALGKALELLDRVGMDIVMKEETNLTAQFLEGMNRVPGIRIYGIKSHHDNNFSSKAGVISFDFKKIIAHTVAKRLANEFGIGIRSGCHCAHLIVKRILGVASPFEGIQRLIVLAAPGLNLPGVARVSLGIENTGDDAERLVKSLESMVGKKRDS
ncbi:MAG: aminotransferase class V-fold PLP-dependent enzyme [Bacteroidales bacterium]|jgi:selenocysteine lyase/cysteine desulfurase|nr:aminotransferase class V-fold PLP-dependent enzyme [Bacteroidales bacterium]